MEDPIYSHNHLKMYSFIRRSLVSQGLALQLAQLPQRVHRTCTTPHRSWPFGVHLCHSTGMQTTKQGQGGTCFGPLGLILLWLACNPFKAESHGTSTRRVQFAYLIESKVHLHDRPDPHVSTVQQDQFIWRVTFQKIPGEF